MIWSPAAPAPALPLLLVDATSLQVLYAEDAGQPWHPASLTKLMTAYIAFAAIQAGRVSLETPVTLSPAGLAVAPAKSGLKAGAALTLRDALYVMLVKSANDIAYAIAETIAGDEKTFVAQMNLMARQMGLSATHFTNAHGLHDNKQVSTARDLAMLALVLQRDFPKYREMFETATVKLGTTAFKSNNEMLTRFAGVTGMKTGFVCASGLNIVATLKREGRALLAVVLGGSSARERNELAGELFSRALAGGYAPQGRTVLDLPNLAVPPVDMRSRICGKDAKAYVKARARLFPFGLKGERSYLSSGRVGRTYVASDLGKRVTGVPLPRRRPNRPVDLLR